MLAYCARASIDSAIAVSTATPYRYSGLGSAMGEGLRFLWNATRGHRLIPWRSAYLRWRLETYTGKSAETIVGRDFLRFAWEDKGQFLRFLRWTGEIRGY